MGTTVLPFPTIDLEKDAEIVGDDGDGLAVPGDTIHYTMSITNRGIAPVDDLTVNDEVPAHTTYVPGSTTANGNPVADDADRHAVPARRGRPGRPAGARRRRDPHRDLRVAGRRPAAGRGHRDRERDHPATDYGIYTDIEIVPLADPGSIGDRVWNDADGDGVQDGGETGLVGVTVELLERRRRRDRHDHHRGQRRLHLQRRLPRHLHGPHRPDQPARSGMGATFDLDGTATAHQASVTLADGQDRTDADFGYATSTITLAKTVYLGHDGGSTCPGGELATGEPGDDITYCFRVTNTGAVALVGVGVDDPDLAIDESAMSLESGNPATAGRRPVRRVVLRDPDRRRPGQHRRGRGLHLPRRCAAHGDRHGRGRRDRSVDRHPEDRLPRPRRWRLLRHRRRGRSRCGPATT